MRRSDLQVVEVVRRTDTVEAGLSTMQLAKASGSTQLVAGLSPTNPRVGAVPGHVAVRPGAGVGDPHRIQAPGRRLRRIGGGAAHPKLRPRYSHMLEHGRVLIDGETTADHVVEDHEVAPSSSRWARWRYDVHAPVESKRRGGGKTIHHPGGLHEGDQRLLGIGCEQGSHPARSVSESRRQTMQALDRPRQKHGLAGAPDPTAAISASIRPYEVGASDVRPGHARRRHQWLKSCVGGRKIRPCECPQKRNAREKDRRRRPAGTIRAP